ncbi:invasion associated locus B family protein [Acidimangrovimonas pyrenivorans]|uniref:Invasion associated locus B family protein n=1 Tax=Acidimangrovimonas pyrenivorans TaxID=2030798 RepID=A0ABV7AEN7_9RHOB
MSNLTKALTLALALPFAQAAIAQDSTAQPGDATKPADTQTAPAAAGDTTPSTDQGLSMGKDVPGSLYFKDSFDDWKMRCTHMPKGNDPCELYQLLRDDQNNPVSEVSIFPLPPGGQAIAGATIVTPLETLLTRDITIQVDGQGGKRYPFSWCTQAGCFARVGFTAEDLAAFRKGAKASVSIVPVAAPNQVITLPMSLKGFTAGFAAVEENNNKVRANMPDATAPKN